MPHTKMNLMEIMWCNRASYDADDLFKVHYFHLKAAALLLLMNVLMLEDF